MDEERVEALITNMELAENNLDKLSRIMDPQADPENLIDQTIKLLRQTLEDLRNYEVQKEIEQHSNE